MSGRNARAKKQLQIHDWYDHATVTSPLTEHDRPSCLLGSQEDTYGQAPMQLHSVISLCHCVYITERSYRDPMFHLRIRG